MFKDSTLKKLRLVLGLNKMEFKTKQTFFTLPAGIERLWTSFHIFVLTIMIDGKFDLCLKLCVFVITLPFCWLSFCLTFCQKTIFRLCSQIHAELDDLVARCPSGLTCETVVHGVTHQGRNIKGIRVRFTPST